MTPDKRKELAVFTVPALGFGYGFVFGAHYNDMSFIRHFQWLYGLFFLVPMLVWCHADAEVRDIRISRTQSFALLFFAWFAFPYYLFKSRGWRGLKSLVLLFGLLVWARFMALLSAIMVGGWPYMNELARSLNVE